jgi:virginiamycin B lyase
VPVSLTPGADGAIWVTERPTTPGDTAAVERIGPDGGRRSFPLAPGATPSAIVLGSDGAMWMSDPGRTSIDRLTASGVLTEYHSPATPGSSLTLAADGTVWYSEQTADRLARITTSGDIHEWPVPAGRQPGVVAAGPDGSIFFAEAGVPRLGSMSLTGTVNESDLADPMSRIVAVTTGPGPAIWYVTSGPNGAQVGRLDTAGHLRQVPIGGAATSAISVGPDGKLWLPGPDPNTITVVGLAGTAHRQLDQPVRLDALATTTDGTVWAIDGRAHHLVRLTSR